MGRSGRKPHRDKRWLRGAGSRRAGPARPLGSAATPPRSPAPSSECADDEPSRLARAFRAGDPTALAALYRLLQPVMAPVLAYYAEGPGLLPTSIESADLDQECWLILAELIKRWRPTRGSFA